MRVLVVSALALQTVVLTNVATSLKIASSTSIKSPLLPSFVNHGKRQIGQTTRPTNTSLFNGRNFRFQQSFHSFPRGGGGGSDIISPYSKVSSTDLSSQERQDHHQGLPLQAYVSPSSAPHTITQKESSYDQAIMSGNSTEDLPLLFSKARESNQLGDLLRRIVFTVYSPKVAASCTSFMDRIQVQRKGNVQVKVAVLSASETREIFGVSTMTKNGIQPVWIEIDNGSPMLLTKKNNEKDDNLSKNKNDDNTTTEEEEEENDAIATAKTTNLFLDRVKLDPNYYPPREAVNICHFMKLSQIARYGLASWLLFLPLLIVLPSKWFTSFRANKLMDDFFCQHSFPNGIIQKGTIERGFIFTSLDDGKKVVNIDLLSSQPSKNVSFTFRIPVPGIALDYRGETPTIDKLYPNYKQDSSLPKECKDLKQLKHELSRNQPRAVTNKKGTKEGDPLNLVIVGDFATVLTAFGSRWDETETISLESCWKTAKSFALGSQYRYCPVSALYLYGRSQDFALQRARQTINERLHLRLWLSTLTYKGQSIWIGQISRDIGVRLAKTWNLTTHQIDPNVDEARNYVMADLVRSGHLQQIGYVDGVGESYSVDNTNKTRRNLTGDPYVTDGKRAVIILSPTKVDHPQLINWS